jgi:hypothetical protein
MSHNNDASNPWLKAYMELLGNIGIALVVVTVTAALLSTVFYCAWSKSIEQINNRDLSPWWTSLLLWIPIVIQVLVYWQLRKQIRKAISDHRLRVYFRFYFRRMAISLLAYTMLWFCYVVVLRFGGKWLALISWLALIGILILMGIVIHATYLVTRPSFQDYELLLTPEQVSSKYEFINEALRGGSGTPGNLIKQWLSQDRDYKIYKAALATDINHVGAAHLAEALNRLIQSPRFFEDAKAVEPGDSPTNPSEGPLPKEIEQFNRSFLDRNLFKLKSPSTPKGIDGKARARQLKLCIQQGQRDGMAMFPFYTLVFFFSVFLCIAYLFGFAFAFDDKYVQLESSRGRVALLMNDDLLEDAGRSSGSASFRISDFKQPAALIVKLRDHDNAVSNYLRTQFNEKTRKLLDEYDGSETPSETLQSAVVTEFNKLLNSKKSLFDERRFAEVTLTDDTKDLMTRNNPEVDLIRLNRLLLENAFANEITPSHPQSFAPLLAYTKRLRKMFYFNSGGAGVQVRAGDSPDDNDKYISKINNESFADLLSEISGVLDTGKRARLVLVGRADDNGLSKESNGPKKKKANKNTYASNHDLAATRIKTVRYELERLFIEKALSPTQLQTIDWIELAVSNDETLPLKALEESESGGFNDDAVRNDPSEPRATSDKVGEATKVKDVTDIVSKPLRADVQAYRRRLEKQAGKLTKDNVNDLYNQIQEWIELKTSGENAKAARKKDIIEEALYRLENLTGSKRSVEVFFYEAHDLEYQPDPHMKRMALMDYIYFAMYTITTTGYGDIKPITPYSKFLCTLANITEFFFIVVFFNTLLSLRRVKGDTV